MASTTGIDEKTAYGDQRGEKFELEQTSKSSATDEAEAQVAGGAYDEAEAERVLRKVDWRLVPILSLLYLVAFIDRSNSTFSNPEHIHKLSAMYLTLLQLATRKSQA
jgi:hypothetical protein